MIRKNLRWMAACILATNLAIATPSPLMAAGKANGNKKITEAPYPQHRSSTW